MSNLEKGNEEKKLLQEEKWGENTLRREEMWKRGKHIGRNNNEGKFFWEGKEWKLGETFLRGEGMKMRETHWEWRNINEGKIYWEGN